MYKDAEWQIDNINMICKQLGIASKDNYSLIKEGDKYIIKFKEKIIAEFTDKLKLEKRIAQLKEHYNFMLGKAKNIKKKKKGKLK